MAAVTREPELKKGGPTLFARLSRGFYRPINRKQFNDMVLKSSKSVSLEEKRVNTTSRLSESFQITDPNISQVIEESGAEMCSLCCERLADTVIMPCGHGELCTPCLRQLQLSNKRCHVCREEISTTVKVRQNSKFAYADI